MRLIPIYFLCLLILSQPLHKVLANSVNIEAYLELNNSDTFPVVTSSQVPVLLENNYRYNASPFGHNNLVTAYDSGTGIWWQYLAFWNHNRQASVTRRNFSTNGDWEPAVNIHQAIGGDVLEADNHNIIALGVDQEGYIHISGNHHSDPLNYARSSSPHSLTGFVNVPSMIPGDVKASENRVTYPAFVNTTHGDLLFVYRNQTVSPSVFSTYINRWNTQTQSWQRLSKIASGAMLRFYTQRIAVDHSNNSTHGRIHIMAMWRDDGAGGSGTAKNEDLFHLFSDDHGETWKQYGSTRALSLPLGWGDPDLILDTRPHPNSRYMVNQSGLEIDADGYPHALLTMSVSSGSKNNRYHHVWYDGSRWQIRALDKIKPGNRSAIVTLQTGEVFGMMQTGDGLSSSLKLLNLTPGDNRYDSEVVTISSGLTEQGSSPNYDAGALYHHHTLSFVATRAPLDPKANNDNYLQDATVVNIDLSQFQRLRSNPSLAPGLEKTDEATVSSNRNVSGSDNSFVSAVAALASNIGVYRRPSYARITVTATSVGAASGSATIRYPTVNGYDTAGLLELGGGASTSSTPLLPLPDYIGGPVSVAIANESGKGHLVIERATVETYRTKHPQFPVFNGGTPVRVQAADPVQAVDPVQVLEKAQVVCIDSDGDGWGWDGTETCLVGGVVTTGNGSCVDNDGDGWGWDGSESCLVEP